MENLRELLDSMFKEAIIQGAQVSGWNTNLLIPVYLEYITYQLFLLAPLEVEQWLKTMLEQCKSPNTPLPQMTQAREDLTLTLEMVMNL